MPEPTSPPHGWNDRRLTNYFQIAHENRYATAHNYPHASLELIELDAALFRYSNSMINPQPRICADLMARAHILFVNVCELAFSTQQYTAVVVARSAIEAASYAMLISSDQAAESMWLDRGLSKNKKDIFRKYFTHSKILTTIKNANPALHDLYDRLYETLIDFGAHPNSSGILTGSQEIQTENGIRCEQIALTNDDHTIKFGLKIAFDVGVFIAATLTHIFDHKGSNSDLNHAVTALLAAHNERIENP